MSLVLAAMLQTAALASPPPATNAMAQDAVVAGESYEAQLQRARALATSGDAAQREQALALYTEMLARSPDNSDVQLARGRTYAWMGRHAEAEADLKAVVERKPDYADAWSALGDLYLWSDRPADAGAAYAHWVELAPNEPAALIARGRAHRAAGDLAAARADFDAAQAHGADAAEVGHLQASLMLPPAAVSDALIGSEYRWQLRGGVDKTMFSGGRADWTDAELSLRRRFARGSLALETLRAHRFDQTDTAWALDGYASLWSRAYGNARYQRGPSDGILPRDAWRLELFQGVGQGWELSASIDHLRFDSDTEFYGVGVGRYVGNWYARYKLQHVPGAGSGSWSHRLVVRNYYRGDADDYVEVNASNGRSTDLDRNGGLVRDSHFAFGAAWMHYFHPQWGFKLGAGYADDADGYDERNVSLYLYHRW